MREALAAMRAEQADLRARLTLLESRLAEPGRLPTLPRAGGARSAQWPLGEDDPYGVRAARIVGDVESSVVGELDAAS